MSDSPELLKPNAELVDSELHTKLGNLKVENETLRADYAKLLQSSTHIAHEFSQNVERLQAQLEEEIARCDELSQEARDLEEFCSELRSQLEIERAEREKIEAERVELAQFNKGELPEAADLLNQLKAKYKKSRASLTDVQKILEIL